MNFMAEVLGFLIGSLGLSGMLLWFARRITTHWDRLDGSFDDAKQREFFEHWGGRRR
jgi:hypothetical protein